MKEFAALLQRGADNHTVSVAEEFTDVADRDAAAEKNLRVRTGAPHPLNIGNVRRDAGARSRNNERVSQTAFQRIVRGVFDCKVPERHRVLHVHIGKNGHGRANPFTVSHGFVRVALDDALIGEHRAGMDVDADEAAAARRAQCQRGAGIVAENIESYRQIGCGPYRAACG